MKNALRWTLSLSFLALIAVACQQAADSPTAPSKPSNRADDGSGSVTAQAGPSGPTNAGPGSSGAGPGSGSAGPGTGGTNGGTPTPTPTPGGTPTPTPTPDIPCPDVLTVDAVGTPMLVSDAVNNAALFPITPTNFDPRCTVKEVRVMMHVTTVNGFVVVSSSENYTRPSAIFETCGGGTGPGLPGCYRDTLYAFSGVDPATGNDIGTTCQDFAFDTAATTPWDPSAVTSPYSGVYQLDPARSGIGKPWSLSGLHWAWFAGDYHPPDAVLECAQVVVTTQLVP